MVDKAATAPATCADVLPGLNVLRPEDRTRMPSMRIGKKKSANTTACVAITIAKGDR